MPFPFEDHVDLSGGTFKKWEQSEYIKRLGPDFKKGACFGICCAYLSRNYNRKIWEGHENETFTKYMETGDSLMIARNIQWAEKLRGTSPLGEFIALANKAVAEATKNELTPLLEPLDSKRPFTDIISRLTNAKKRFYHLVAAGNHAMAAVTNPPDKKWKFFDPNYGQAIFKNIQNFESFVRVYFSANAFLKDYDGDRLTVTTY
jgi:Yersinia/Haemophilus virulence surface antigen